MSDLDEKEQNNVRATLNFLRGQIGSTIALAKALRFEPATVNRAMNSRGPVTVMMAFRVARLLDASVDDLLAGRYRPGACAKCGHVPSYMPAAVSDFINEDTAVGAAPATPQSEGLKLVR